MAIYGEENGGWQERESLCTTETSADRQDWISESVEISDVKMVHNEHKRVIALRERREFGGNGNAQNKIWFFTGGKNKKGDSSVQVEISVEAEEHVERLLRCTDMLREDRDRQ